MKRREGPGNRPHSLRPIDLQQVGAAVVRAPTTGTSVFRLRFGWAAFPQRGYREGHLMP